MVVAVDDELALLRLHGERRDLLGEPAFRHGGRAELVATQGVLVLSAAPDAEPLRDLLRRLRHVETGDGIVEARVQHVLQLGDLAEGEARARVVHHVRRLAHVLHAAREDRLRLVEQDRLRARHDRLAAGAAQTIHGESRYRLRHSRLEGDVPRAVDRVDRSLQCVPDDHVVDVLRRHLGSLQRRARGVDAQVDRRNVLQLAETRRADVLAHGSAGAADDRLCSSRWMQSDRERGPGSSFSGETRFALPGRRPCFAHVLGGRGEPEHAAPTTSPSC
jgi:hypothetical protein